MNNKERMKEAYDEVHAPDVLLRKVMAMKNKEAKREVGKRMVLRYAVAVAGLAIVLAGSNGICYAATGETWIEKVKVYVNGNETEQEMTYYKEGDKVVGELELEVQDGTYAMIANTTNIEETEVIDVSIFDTSEDAATEMNRDGLGGKLCSQNGKTILEIGGQNIDITEDYADGEATGKFDFKGSNYQYTVTGDVESYNISVVTIGKE